MSDVLGVDSSSLEELLRRRTFHFGKGGSVNRAAFKCLEGHPVGKGWVSCG